MGILKHKNQLVWCLVYSEIEMKFLLMDKRDTIKLYSQYIAAGGLAKQEVRASASLSFTLFPKNNPALATSKLNIPKYNWYMRFYCSFISDFEQPSYFPAWDVAWNSLIPP